MVSLLTYSWRDLRCIFSACPFRVSFSPDATYEPDPQTVTIEEVRNHLTELIHRLIPDAEVVITENNQPVARLVPAALPSEARKVPRLGMLKAGLPRFLTSLWDEPDNK